ncbi:MAG: ABC transporter ATP-binding protein [Verrucomicrobiae bacterium]|nr:ABC transporter ATP-binding protein [Verrucomicrobiae bacterium]
MPLLETHRLRRAFGGLIAVNDVSLNVERGQIKGLIGPNGAGKTTCFNLISGLLRPDAGQVVFDGHDITGWPPFRIARLGMARTFQNPSLFPRLNVLENVMVGCHARTHHDFLSCALRWPGMRREERAIREQALEQLRWLGLESWATRPAHALAFGQRRMVELARALAAQPSLLLLDEPASGLNPSEKVALAETIRQIRARGVTILLVEHDMPLVMSLADDLLVLHFGSAIAEGPPEVIRRNPKVIDIYLGQEATHAFAS